MLPLVTHPEVDRPLYPHQAAVWDAWEKNDTFLVTSKTGTGKTLAALLPILKKEPRANCICVYPTNELIRDQSRALGDLLTELGYSAVGDDPSLSASKKSSGTDADVRIVQLDSVTLDRRQYERTDRNRSLALVDLLRTDQRTIVLTNPDILFLILAIRYSGQAFAAIASYDALVIDEFHLYTGVELAHALYMLHVVKTALQFQKILILTATPEPDVEEYIDSILMPLHVDLQTPTFRPHVGVRIASQGVTIRPQLIGVDLVDTAAETIAGLLGHLEQARDQHLAGFVPGVVILSSVVDAIRLEDVLCEKYQLRREDLAIIRGLSSRSIRNIEGKLLVIGTSAVEVGVDFHCRYLVFEARDATSFLQRFGRVGRHEPGVSIVLCEPNAYGGFVSRAGSMSRQELERCVRQWYSATPSHSWFVQTRLGLTAAFAMGYSLLQRASRDWRATVEQQQSIRETVLGTCQSYARAIGVSEMRLRSVESNYARMQQGHASWKWLADYVSLDTFRTSLPSIWVFDKAEARRRGEDQAAYRADLSALMRRGRNLRFNAKRSGPEGAQGIVEVDGYGAYQKVSVIGVEHAEDVGVMCSSSESSHIHFLQAGHSTPLSHSMSRDRHVYCVVDADHVSTTDWRLPVFECGERLIAFDGAALLLAEVANRHRVGI